VKDLWGRKRRRRRKGKRWREYQQRKANMAGKEVAGRVGFDGGQIEVC
jgi:hypothetical protein